MQCNIKQRMSVQLSKAYLEKEHGQVSGDLVAADDGRFLLGVLGLAVPGVPGALLVAERLYGEGLGHYLEAPRRQLLLLQRVELGALVKLESLVVVAHGVVELAEKDVRVEVDAQLLGVVPDSPGEAVPRLLQRFYSSRLAWLRPDLVMVW